MALVIILCGVMSAQADDRHWVYEELAAFKQAIVPVVKTIPDNGIITDQEWALIHNEVLSEANLDQPITSLEWASLIKIVLELPASQAETYLNMYAINLSTDGLMLREDAVGGLIKLLTFDYVKGSATGEELQPADFLKDLNQIDDRQHALVRMAYCEYILDSNTYEYFRPKDYLTKAEAISILNKVIARYQIDLQLRSIIAQKHWSSSALAQLKQAKYRP